MRDFQEQSRWRAVFASRTMLSVMLFFLIGMGVISFHALEAGWEAETKREEVKERLRGVEEKKDVLTSELEELRGEEGVEREARQKLNFRKQGEEIIIIRDINEEHQNKETSKAGLFLQVLQWIGIR